jgi:2-haloacid dehalogenase
MGVRARAAALEPPSAAHPEPKGATMPRVCVFDVNETLLDLSAMDVAFARPFSNPAAARRAWFAQMIQSALVGIVTDRYADFTQVGRAALLMTAARENIILTDEEIHSILGAIRRLPPHPDVRGALERLRDAGLRLAALTNSTQQVAEAQLAHAGIRDFFEQVLSADSVRRLKPAPEPYRMAAEKLGVPIGQVRLIAAHPWDVAGALHSGCAAAFVGRPGMPFDPLVERPDIVGETLTDVAEQIVAAEGVHPRPAF